MVEEFASAVNLAMSTLILFLLILTILVLVHEAGHFFTARLFKIGVMEFGVGFPPRAFGWYRDPLTKKIIFVKGGKKQTMQNTVGGGTRDAEFPAVLYSVNWLPIGGFVKIKGENGGDTTSDSFAARPVWQRLIVLVAGVFMNIVLAGLLFGVGFMIGLPTDISEGVPSGGQVVGASKVMIEMVQKGSPADHAGVEVGDTIVRLDTFVPANTTAVTEAVKAHDESPLTLVVMRGSEEKQFEIAPKKDTADAPPRLGVALTDVALIQYPWYNAFFQGFRAAFVSLLRIFAGLWDLVVGLVGGKGLTLDVAGPVGIAHVVGQSASLGLSYIIQVSAMISLSLAAMNILPIPALDGGRALFVAIEGIIRRKVPEAVEGWAHTIGFVFLMILILIVTGRDIMKLFF